MKVFLVAGARPNFMKVAALVAALKARTWQLPGLEPLLIHTGQHYDSRMSDEFFRDLGMPQPDIHLGAGSGTHAEQTARVMVAFEKICQEHKPELVVVVGDVNSTLACALSAKKLGIAVAHVEAGLRSRDMGMPEEINRLCTDVISDFLFTTDRLADRNLVRESCSKKRIHFVGNVMIDSLRQHLNRALAQELPPGLDAGSYALLTLHRPSNVDDPAKLRQLLGAVNEVAERIPILFPAHPRTAQRMAGMPVHNRLLLVEPMGYVAFLGLMARARLVLTDSGGIQEETTVLQVPCITLRENTERPITCEMGTNILAGTDPWEIVRVAERVLASPMPTGRIPEKWDGHAAERIADVLIGWLQRQSEGSSAAPRRKRRATGIRPPKIEATTQKQ